jgi:hypothetical protein
MEMSYLDRPVNYPVGKPLEVRLQKNENKKHCGHYSDLVDESGFYEEIHRVHCLLLVIFQRFRSYGIAKAGARPLGLVRIHCSRDLCRSSVCVRV